MPKPSVAIIGGGVSGLYCALRLVEEGFSDNIKVYEKSRRVGGKIKSEVRDQGVLEHGAWRFSKSHKLVQSLTSSFEKFDYPPCESSATSGSKGYMSQFACRLFSGAKDALSYAIQMDAGSGYVDSSAQANDGGERHGTQYEGLVGGYEQIISELVRRIGEDAEIHTETRVTNVRREHERFTFTLRAGENSEANVVVFACSPNLACHSSSDDIRKHLRILQACIVPLPLCRVYQYSSRKRKPSDAVTNSASHRRIDLGNWNIVSYTSGRVANAWRDLFVHDHKKAERILRGKSEYFYYAEGTHMWKPAYRFCMKRQSQMAVRVQKDLYIVGEALSDTQGWAEGALRSVEELVRHLHTKEKEPKQCKRFVYYRGRVISLHGWAKRHPGGQEFIKNLKNGECIDELFDRVHLSDEPWKQLFALQQA